LQGLIKALLPDAFLRDPWNLHQRVVLLVDESGLISDFCTPDTLPPDVRLEHFPGEVWTAAPILAHAHLESFDAPSASWRRDAFTPWVEDLLAWRMHAERLDAASSAQLSLSELEKNGCGLVLSHVAERGADGQQRDALPAVMPLREVFAPDVESFAAESLEAAKRVGGIALHAPYSVTPEVARQVFAAMEGSGLVSIHLGEHAQERAFLVDGTGPMADLLARRERPLRGGKWTSPVAWLRDMGGLRCGVLAVHGGDLSADELQQLHQAGVALVFCPGTHAYFGRPPTNYLEAGIPLPALGCDSRASNTSLDPLREVALAYKQMPQPGAQAWWQALTQRGAEAVQRRDLGCLDIEHRAVVLRLKDCPEEAQKDAVGLCTYLCSGDSIPRQVSAFSAC